MRRTIPAYAASFSAGWRQAAGDKSDLLSTMLIYGVLITVFTAVFRIMPIEELGVPGLTWHHMLWYFIVTEAIICSQSTSAFGNMIGAGQLTEMMQRPVSILWMFFTRQMGSHVMQTALVFTGALALVPLYAGAAMTMNLALLPALALSIFFGITLFLLLTFIVGTIEVLGPYSRPCAWIVGKFVFTFGGLLFPVSYFPPLMQTISKATPFYAVIGIPGEFMLMPGGAAITKGLLTQIFWIAVLVPVTLLVERRMVRRVLDKGD